MVFNVAATYKGNAALFQNDINHKINSSLTNAFPERIYHGSQGLDQGMEKKSERIGKLNIRMYL